MRLSAHAVNACSDGNGGVFRHDPTFLWRENSFHANETPLLFGYGGNTLYGVIYCPVKATSCPGVIICPPLFTEAMESHGVLVNLARLLAERGYPTLRFDYRGTGESEGQWEEYSIPEYLADIGEASVLLRRKTGGRPIGILGVRMGATMALMKAAEDNSFSFAALIEPVTHGERYVTDLLRLNVAQQLRDFQKVTAGPGKLAEIIQAGNEIMIAGFTLNRERYNTLAAIDLFEYGARISVPSALFSFRTSRAADTSAEKLFETIRSVSPGSIFHRIDRLPFWRQTPRLIRRIPELFDILTEWIHGIASE